jgi:hypothetical protein
MKTKTLLLIYLIAIFSNLGAQEKLLFFQNKKTQLIPTAKFEPNIDGKLSDEIWNITPPFLLTHLNGSVGSPYDKTAVRITASKTHLFVSFNCEEPKVNELISKAQNPDDDISKDDCVTVLISPGVEPITKTYQFSVNGKGIVFDSLNKDKAWNWEGATVAVAKSENFWSVEMSLPFNIFEKDLKKVKARGWRANFYRIRPERAGWEDLTAASWVSVTGSNEYDGEQAGFIFIEPLGEKIPDSATPLVVAAETEYLSIVSVQVPKFNKDEIAIDGDIRDQINAGSIPITFKRIDGKLDVTTAKPIVLKNKTEGWLCTSKDSLVVSVRCYDTSMDKLVSSEKMRDNGNAWMDDSVELFIGIGQEESVTYYHIAVNAHGSIYDSLVKMPDKSGNNAWNGNNIKAATVRKELYWDLEVQIPFEDLDMEKVKASNGQPWRFNVIRHRPVHQADEEIEEAAWSPTNSPQSHVPSRFGYIFMDFMNAKPK